MKGLQSLLTGNIYNNDNNISLSDYFYKSMYIDKPFTDEAILYLQEIFLQNGFHFLQVEDIEFSRTLVKNFLKSLNCHNDIAAISLEAIDCDKKVNNIYHNLIFNGYIDGRLHSDFEEFFLDQWFYDFLWIEASKKLLNSSWINPFLKKMKELNFDKEIPILIFFYQE